MTTLSATLVRKPLALLGRLQNLERTHKRFVHAHHGAGVIKLPTVIRRRKESNELPPSEKLVSVLNDLMGAANQVKIVLVQELSHNVLPKREGHAAVILSPPVDILIRIGPEKVAQKSGIGHVSRTHNALDLIETRELRAEAAVHAENLLVDHGGTGQAVEAVRKRLPELNPKPTFAFVVKAVDAVDRGALVVPSKDEKILRVLDLVRHEQADCFQRLLPPIDVISQKYVVRLRGKPTVLKETEQVIVLAVDIAHDFDWRLEFEEHGLPDKEIATAEAEHLYLRLGQIYLLPGASTANAQQLVYDNIDRVVEQRHATAYGSAADGLLRRALRRRIRIINIRWPPSGRIPIRRPVGHGCNFLVG